MRIGGARSAPPPSQTGLADLPHPAFQSAVPRWAGSGSCSRMLGGNTPAAQSPLDPLTLLRAAHCQQTNLGQAALRRTDALSLAALRRPL